MHRIRNYEVVTKRKYNDRDDYSYSANTIPVPVKLSNKQGDELSNKFDSEADKYLEQWIKIINKDKDNCQGEAYFSGSTDFIIPYGLCTENIYWDYYTNKYSKSKIKNYIKYTKCVKNHNHEDITGENLLVYFTEHFDDNFVTSVMTEEEREIKRKGHDELIAVCNKCNCAFRMSEINKGFLWALVKDLRRFIRKY